MKKSILLLPFVCMSLFSCEKNKDEYDFYVTDMIGRKVGINNDDYKRVLCIGAGALRMYSYIGDINNIIAAEDIDRNVGMNPFTSVSRPYYDINKEYLSTLPSCGKGGPKAQFAEEELILNCRPSMIISEYEDITKADNLQNKTGVPVIVLDYGKKAVFDDAVNNSLLLLGKALHKEERAHQLVNYIGSEKTNLKDLVKNVDDSSKESIYIGCLGNWGRCDILSTSATYPIFDAIGINNAVEASLVKEGNIEKESFVKLNPDKIILDSAGIEKFKETYKADTATFDKLNAFKNNEVYLQMAYNAYYTNIEIALMDTYFAGSVAYPEIFTSEMVEAKYKEIGMAFLNSDVYEIIKDAKMSYGGFKKINNIKEFLNA